MKKIFKYLLTILLLLSPIAIFGQTNDIATSQFDFNLLFTTIASFSAGVLILTGLVTKYILKNLSSLGRSITSWVVALIMGVLGWYFHVGIFNEINIYGLISVIIGFAASSNVIYNAEWVRVLLIFLQLVPPKTTTTKTIV
jgi:hypothetical protein